MPNEKAAEPLSEEKLAEKKVCEVCGRARCKRQIASVGSLAWGECYALGYERLAAILTPEVLRLREAGRALQEAARREDEAKRRVRAGPQDKASLAAMYKAAEDVGGALGQLCGAALALPFEKPAECNHTEKQQLPKKGGE